MYALCVAYATTVQGYATTVQGVMPSVWYIGFWWCTFSFAPGERGALLACAHAQSLHTCRHLSCRDLAQKIEEDGLVEQTLRPALQNRITWANDEAVRADAAGNSPRLRRLTGLRLHGRSELVDWHTNGVARSNPAGKCARKATKCGPRDRMAG